MKRAIVVLVLLLLPVTAAAAWSWPYTQHVSPAAGGGVGVHRTDATSEIRLRCTDTSGAHVRVDLTEREAEDVLDLLDEAIAGP